MTAELTDHLDDLRDDLDAFLASIPDEPPESDEPAFPPVGDLVEVEKWMRRYARLSRRRASIIEVAKAEAQRIVEWADDQTGIVDRQMAWVERTLDSWMRVNHDEGGAATISLPSGTLALRKAARKVEVEIDGDETLADLRRAGFDPVPTWKLPAQAIKDALTMSDDFVAGGVPVGDEEDGRMPVQLLRRIEELDEETGEVKETFERVRGVVIYEPLTGKDPSIGKSFKATPASLADGEPF